MAIQWPIILIVFGIVFLPESPRWFIVKNQYHKAWNVLWEFGSNEVRINESNLPFTVSVYESFGIFLKKYFLCRILFVSFIIAVANLAVAADIVNPLSETTKENMHYVEASVRNSTRKIYRNFRLF